MSSAPGPRRRGRRIVRKVLVGAAATAAAGAVGYAGARRVVKTARSGPSLERGEDLSGRPGEERRVVSFDGTELAVNVLGPERAPTLVLLHGFSGDLTLWHYQWEHFSGRYRCVLFDHRGHGRSGRAAGGDYSLEVLGEDVKAVLDAEGGSGPAVLVGHSMGAMAILAFARQYPRELGTRVGAVVLANTAASDLVKAMAAGLGAYAGRFLTASALRLAARPRRLYRLRSRALSGGGDVAFLATRLANFGPDAPPSVVQYVAEVGARAPVEVWSDLLASLVGMDLSDALELIRVPALVLASDLDRLTPPASARAVAKGLPDARLVELVGAGHCSMLERPREFNEAVERFLQESLGRRTRRAHAGSGVTAARRRGTRR